MKFTDKQKKLFDACNLVEQAMREIGKDCEVITMDESVQIACLSWRGCIEENSLYEAIMTAKKEINDTENT